MLSSANLNSAPTVLGSIFLTPVLQQVKHQDGLDLSQPKPVELIWSHGQWIRNISYAREKIPAKHLYQNVPFVSTQVEFHRLGRTGKIVHNENGLVVQFANVCEHSMVSWIEKLD